MSDDDILQEIHAIVDVIIQLKKTQPHGVCNRFIIRMVRPASRYKERTYPGKLDLVALLIV